MSSEVDPEKRKRALDKIKKCFALAKSSNAHEAEAAMRQAQKLMDKFKLELGDVHASRAEEFTLKVGSAFALPVWTAGTYPECQQKISTDVGRQSSQPADHFLSTPCRLGICSPA